LVGSPRAARPLDGTRGRSRRSWRARSSPSRCSRRSSSRGAGRNFRGNTSAGSSPRRSSSSSRCSSAVELFAAEPEETAAETGTNRPGTTLPEPPPPPPLRRRGRRRTARSSSRPGLRSCHTFKAASATGTVGPDLDTALKGKDAAFVHESIVDPNKEIAPGYQPNIMPENFGQTLTPTQINDLVAFLQSG
jgi:hypothetical protein